LIVALGATRPNTWTLFVVAAVLAVGAATILTLAIPRMYPFSVDPGPDPSISPRDKG
jgi:hypothetical protein